MFGKSSTSNSHAHFRLSDFAAKLTANGRKYAVSDDKKRLDIRFKGDNFERVTFSFIFDDDGKSVAIRAYSIYKFSISQLANAYEFCNRMNNKNRWISLYVDSENELTASMDAVISKNNAAEVCYELCDRMVNIVDMAYGELMS